MQVPSSNPDASGATDAEARRKRRNQSRGCRHKKKREALANSKYQAAMSILLKRMQMMRLPQLEPDGKGDDEENEASQSPSQSPSQSSSLPSNISTGVKLQILFDQSAFHPAAFFEGIITHVDGFNVQILFDCDHQSLACDLSAYSTDIWRLPPVNEDSRANKAAVKAAVAELQQRKRRQEPMEATRHVRVAEAATREMIAGRIREEKQRCRREHEPPAVYPADNGGRLIMMPSSVCVALRGADKRSKVDVFNAWTRAVAKLAKTAQVSSACCLQFSLPLSCD